MIRLYNTRTRRKEEFVPLDPTNVRMYVCGPTVYDRAHLGNARPVIVFDVLYRLLRHVYGADHVTYVRNFTDVDDRINQTAVERRAAGAEGSLVELIRARSDETIDWYHQDMAAVGALLPDHEPRATEWIGAMVAMIVDLIAKGHAYEAEGHVLFAVESYAAYGALSGRSVDDMIAGARVEVAPYKRNPMDFVLWKPSGEELPGWDSPWGRGRPGWHIECSAMAHELLGPSFDIHAGGIDLQFPHHENEIAQSACAYPEGGFASVWMHNEMLQVEGRKMSKSLGNFFTVRDLLDQGVPGEVIRFVMLSTHYGKPMDWTEKKRAEAEATLREWRKIAEVANDAGNVDQGFVDTLRDDLNTAGAIARLHAMAKAIAATPTKDCAFETGVFLSSARLLGLLEYEMRGWTLSPIQATASLTIDISLAGTASVSSPTYVALVEALIAERDAARSVKNFDRADELRDGFKCAGIRIEDTPNGPLWTVEKGEIDSQPFFHSVRAAFAAGDEGLLAIALQEAEEAGIHFSDKQHLDISPAWIGYPSETHILRVLNDLHGNGVND